MTHPDPSELVHVPLFAKLTLQERTTLARQIQVEPLQPGTTIVTQGSPGYAFYVLRDGAADVVRDGVVIDRMGRGEFFGELTCLNGQPRNASVIATEPGAAWCLFGTAFRVFRSQHPEFAAAIGEVAQRRQLVDR